MSLIKLKQYLNSPDKMILLLERLGLRNIKLEQNNTLVTCGLPNNSNKRSVQVKLNQQMSMAIRNKNIYGDIVDLVSYMTYEGFGEFDETVMDFMRYDTTRWLIGNLDSDFDDFEYDESIVYDYEEHNKNVLLPNQTYNEVILNEFIPKSHISWIKEGIKDKVQREFDICYNSHDNQIVIPCRNANCEIVSLKVRNLTIVESEYYSTPKYLSILKPSKGVDLYGLWKTKEHIKKRKQVVLFESEKSVIKAWQYGCKNTVAMATSSMSHRQRQQLIEVLEPDSEIVIALDNDMEMYDIKRISNSFKKHDFKITYIKQNTLTDNVYLEGKDAPVDKGRKVFRELYNNRKSLI